MHTATSTPSSSREVSEPEPEDPEDSSLDGLARVHVPPFKHGFGVQSSVVVLVVVVVAVAVVTVPVFVDVDVVVRQSSPK